MDRKLRNEELGRPDLEEYLEVPKNPIVVVLDNIRSLNNVGSVFRSSDAFSVEAIYLCGITAQPPHREINKTALGATESVSWKYFDKTENALKSLKKQGYGIWSIEQTERSISLPDFNPLELKKKIALVFGHEVKGVQQEVVNLSDGVLEIPQSGTKHSLNISVSVGVVLWDLINKLKQ
ncbi:MAG: RNA methyltransferase [Vicingaceae bacterium]